MEDTSDSYANRETSNSMSISVPSHLIENATLSLSVAGLQAIPSRKMNGGRLSIKHQHSHPLSTHQNSAQVVNKECHQPCHRGVIDHREQPIFPTSGFFDNCDNRRNAREAQKHKHHEGKCDKRREFGGIRLGTDFLQSLA